MTVSSLLQYAPWFRSHAGPSRTPHVRRASKPKVSRRRLAARESVPFRTVESVAVVGNYGNRNLGDEATLESLLIGLKQRRPHVSVTAFSYDPRDTQQRHGIAAVPALRTRPVPADRGGGRRERMQKHALVGLIITRLVSLARDVSNEIAHTLATLQVLRRTQLLIIGGGGQLDDQFGGAWGTPFYIAKLVILARLTRNQVVFTSIGAGPIRSRGSRLLFQVAMRCAAYVSFRDHESFALARRLRLVPDAVVTTDLAFSLSTRAVPAVSRSNVIAINPIAYHDPRYWPGADERAYQAYVETLARLAALLVRRGYEVLLIPSQLRADAAVIADILGATARQLPPGMRISAAHVESVPDLLAALSSARVVVASRFHGVVCSLAMARPVIALSSHHKIDSVMESFDLSTHVVAAEGADAELVAQHVEDLDSAASAVMEQREGLREGHRTRVEDELDRLFGTRCDAGIVDAQSDRR